MAKKAIATKRRSAEIPEIDSSKWPAHHLEQWAIDRLLPYARNARIHTPEQVDQIARSIREFGWTMPVLIDEGGRIIAGHGRVMAANKLGIVSVPVLIARGWSDAQKRAYTLADNKLTENAGWDENILRMELHELHMEGFDLNLTGFMEVEVVDFLAGIGDGAGNAQDGEEGKLLAERFGVPPFSVLNAREGWWQARKRAWLSLGIQSELGRGENLSALDGAIERREAIKREGLTYGNTPQITEPGLNYYRNRKGKKKAIPGGSLMPATNYSKSGKRGDGKGKAIDG